MADAKHIPPIFSVVMPAHNSARYIGEALESALGQGRADVEIIVIDDGSTDDTAAVVERFGGRVRLIRQENAGSAAARNRGVEAATGWWIAFLDSDDRWLPGHLDRLEDAIRLHPDASLVYSCAFVIDGAGRRLKPKPCPPLGPDPFVTLLLANTVTTSCAAARRDLMLKIGGFHPPLKRAQDMDVWLRLARLGRVVRVPIVTGLYRRQDEDMISRTGRTILDNNLAVVERAASYASLPQRTLDRAWAACYYENAVRRLAVADAAGARADAAAALRQRPLHLRAAMVWALSLGGATAARAAKRLWRRNEGQGVSVVAATSVSATSVAATLVAGSSIAVPLRVDYLITDSGAGGAEKMLSALIRGLDPARYRPRLIVLKPPGKTAEELQRAGVTVEWLGLPAGLGAAYALGLPSAGLRLLRLLRQDPPAILHCWLFQANLLGRVVGRIAGVPAVISSLRVMESERFVQFPLDRLTRRLVDRYVAVSTSTALLYADRLRLDPLRLTVIPNGIEAPAAFDRAAARAALLLTADDRAVLFLGRLHRQKGLDVLLAALPAAIAAAPGLKLFIAGDGPERSRLEAQARGLGIAGSVTFLGSRNPGPLLAAADCLVLPSRWEGMPNAALEAMAAGLPVVATAVGAAPEMLVSGAPDHIAPDETGIIVASEDPPALAAALAAVLIDPQRAAAMGRAGRDRAAARYALSRMIEEHDRLYRELIRPV